MRKYWKCLLLVAVNCLVMPIVTFADNIVITIYESVAFYQTIHGDADKNPQTVMSHADAWIPMVLNVMCASIPTCRPRTLRYSSSTFGPFAGTT